MRKKKHDGAHENHERWLLTYADMITLLVAFFIMLYAMSVMSKAKFEQLALSVRSGFDGNVRMQAVQSTPGVGILNSNALISPEHVAAPDFQFKGADRSSGGSDSDERKKRRAAELEEESMEKVRQKIQDVAKKRGVQSDIQVIENEKGLVIRILTDKLLFARGDGSLQPDSKWILDPIAGAIEGIPNNICVEGHTDDLPIHTPQYPSNWELSMARAASVLHYLADTDHVPETRLSGSGYADTRPILPNTSEANRARNRRVDILVLRSAINTETE